MKSMKVATAPIGLSVVAFIHFFCLATMADEEPANGDDPNN